MKVKQRRHVLLASIMIITAALAAMFFEPLTNAVRIDEPEMRLIGEARDEFADFLAAPKSRKSRQSLLEHGFETAKAGRPLNAVRLDEVDGDCAGRGSYMVSQGNTSPVLMSAPHRGYDKHTGTLALQLFGEGGLAAAAWNSAPRRAKQACPNAADLARSSRNHFTAFSLAFADTYPGGRIVQLHGFDRDMRSSQAGAQADIILSNGTQQAGDDLLDIADCLSGALAPRNVLVYPNDISELGALSNAQGQALREQGFASFIHVEISLGFRKKLIADPASRQKLLTCLTNGLEA